MITVEDKLNIFYKIVLEKEKENFSKTLSQLQEKNKIILDEYREKTLSKRDEIIKKETKNGEMIKNEKISQALIEERNKILKKKEELLKELLLSIEEKGKEFSKSKEYEKYFLEELGKTFCEMSEKDIILYLKQEDSQKYRQSILALANRFEKEIVFEEANKDIIGGFLISDKDRTYLIDQSFKAKIEENKYLIGQKLYEKLEKAGDILD